VVDTPSEPLKEVMRKQSQLWLQAEDTLLGAIEAACLPWVLKHCAVLDQHSVAAMLQSAPDLEEFATSDAVAEVWFTLACCAGDLPFAVRTAVAGNLAAAVDAACTRGDLPATVAESDMASAREALANHSGDLSRAEVSSLPTARHLAAPPPSASMRAIFGGVCSLSPRGV
jgi:hypothetical protein